MCWWGRTTINTWYYNIKNFRQNIWFFTKLAWKWRPWDNQYNIDVLVALTKKTGQLIGYNSRHTSHVKTYRRAMAAAGYLEKAYSYSVCDDKAYMNLMRNNPIKFEEIEGEGGYKLMTHDYKVSEEYHTKLSDIATKRITRVEKELKAHAWAYYIKYCESFWD